MSKLLEDVLNFLSSATQAQLEENWKHLEPYENIGPNAKEFIEYRMNDFRYTLCGEINNSIIVNDKNPEYDFGFFIL